MLPGGEVVTTSGIYTDTLIAANGCDSIQSYLVGASPSITVTAVKSGTNLVASASASGVTYQWVRCDSNFKPITGATTATYKPTKNGQYAVVGTSIDGCTDTSSCLTVTGLSIDAPSSVSTLHIYPNPLSARGELTVEGPAVLLTGRAYLITDAAGRTLEHGAFTGAKNTINLRSIPTGIYSLRVEGLEGAVRVVRK